MDGMPRKLIWLPEREPTGAPTVPVSLKIFSAPAANSTAPKKSLRARSLRRSAVKSGIELGRLASFSLVRVPASAEEAA